MSETLPPPAPAATPKKKLSTGAIVGIVVGAVILVGIVIVAVLAAVAVPVLNSQLAAAADSYAKADVSNLGKEIAIYWVDNVEPPVLEAQDGEVLFYDSFDTAFAIPLSKGVEYGGAVITSNTSWCVWVTAPEGEMQDFRYSAQYGLEPGSC